jgi:hypothetical protein
MGEEGKEEEDEGKENGEKGHGEGNRKGNIREKERESFLRRGERARNGGRLEEREHEKF